MAGLTTTLIATGIALSIAGTGATLYGQAQQTAAMSKAEKLRERQMNLESQRQRREAIRQGIIGRSKALWAASTQGANGSGSSALGGATGTIGGEVGGKVLGINQNQEIGSGIFEANRDYYAASGITGLGAGLSSLGGTLISNAGTISKIGTNVFGSGATPTATGQTRNVFGANNYYNSGS